MISQRKNNCLGYIFRKRSDVSLLSCQSRQKTIRAGIVPALIVFGQPV